jgi:hypothetical protein
MLTEKCTAGFRRKVAENVLFWVMTQQAVVRNYHYLLHHNQEQHNSHADRNITKNTL